MYNERTLIVKSNNRGKKIASREYEVVIVSDFQ